MNTFLVYNTVTGATMADCLSLEGAAEAAGPFGHGAATRMMTDAEITACKVADLAVLTRNCRANASSLREVAASMRGMAERMPPGRRRRRSQELSKADSYDRDAADWDRRANEATLQSLLAEG